MHVALNAVHEASCSPQSCCAMPVTCTAPDVQYPAAKPTLSTRTTIQCRWQTSRQLLSGFKSTSPITAQMQASPSQQRQWGMCCTSTGCCIRQAVMLGCLGRQQPAATILSALQPRLLEWHACRSSQDRTPTYAVSSSRWDPSDQGDFSKALRLAGSAVDEAKCIRHWARADRACRKQAAWAAGAIFFTSCKLICICMQGISRKSCQSVRECNAPQAACLQAGAGQQVAIHMSEEPENAQSKALADISQLLFGGDVSWLLDAADISQMATGMSVSQVQSICSSMIQMALSMRGLICMHARSTAPAQSKRRLGHGSTFRALVRRNFVFCPSRERWCCVKMTHL